MNFSELIKERFSCRKFKDTPVEYEKIEKILTAAMVAPTAVNKQPQKILVLTDKCEIEKLKDCTRFYFEQPLCFIIMVDKSKAWIRKYDGKNSGDIDASIVATHMMLQAQEIGLGTTWVMHFDPEAVKKAYNIPDNLEVLALLPAGYPAEDVTVHPLHNEFAEMSDMVKFNKL